MVHVVPALAGRCRTIMGAAVAISTLASVAKVPHATAMRRIHALIESGRSRGKIVLAGF